MDVNQIRELIKIVELSDVSEVIVEEGGAKVVVRKGGYATVDVASATPAAAVSSAAAAAAPAPAADARPAHWKSVIAPMVGTFYRAPSPGAEAFVQVGDSFAEGQPLCILEAMKLMNEIVAEESGVIREIGVENADPVEYGTVLFWYEPAS